MADPSGVSRSTDDSGAQTTNGMPWRAARTASVYVPILFAVSPFAAIRSAPTRITSTSPPAMSGPAAMSGMSVWGTPACLSSHAVSRAPWRYGRVSSTQTWSGRSAAWAAWTTPSAVPNWPQASGPVLQWVRIRSGPSVSGRIAPARLGQAAVVVGRLGDDRHRLAEHRRRDAIAVLRQVAELVVAAP